MAKKLTEEQIANCIRCLSVDMIQKANSGHPGAPMGMAPVATILWSEVMKFNPQGPKWFDRDRFVLSNGHASALQYSMLHLCGYKLTMDDIKQFRQYGSKAPGHPECFMTDGVEVTTGPLGQGVSNGVGLAIAEAHFAATFNKPDLKLIDHYTFVFCGDGCLMEGVAQEALSFAGHQKLHKLILVYDDNHITIDGRTDITFTEDTAAKYTAMGFNILHVQDGNTDYSGIRTAFEEAKKSVDKPTMIILKTIIGIGCRIQDTSKVHGSPLGEEAIKEFKTKVGRNPDKSFEVSLDEYKYFESAAQRGANAHKQWDQRLNEYKTKYPTDYALFKKMIDGELVKDFETLLPKNKDTISTRKASENTLAALIPALPQMIGGSADLTSCNLTRPDGAHMVDFTPTSREGRYLRFGVREHGMCGILNGLHAHGGFIPYGGTFLNFIAYALGSVRLAALSMHQVIYVASHDSIGVGEDGPTHQPTDLVASLHAMANLLVMRPSDQTETSACWAFALQRTTTPTVICLTRQATQQQAASTFCGVSKGAYALNTIQDPQLILIGTGSEVGLVVKAAEQLKELRVRVVSMPVRIFFEEQSEAYKESVLPQGVPTLSVEAFHYIGWDRYSHVHIGMKGFGASAPGSKLFEVNGFMVENVVEKARQLVRLTKGKAHRTRAFSDEELQAAKL